MNGVRHPFTGALYEREPDGTIKVTLDGEVGQFSIDGRWLCGDVREADPQLCGWVGGRRVESQRLSSVDANANGASAG